MSTPGERRDKSLPAVAKTSVAVPFKWFLFDPTEGNPKDAVIVATLGGDAAGISENGTDAVGDTFGITIAGLRWVDVPATVVTAGKYAMSDANGDTIDYVKATEPAKNMALGLIMTTSTGGPGEQVSVEVFEKALTNPDTYPG